MCSYDLIPEHIIPSDDEVLLPRLQSALESKLWHTTSKMKKSDIKRGAIEVLKYRPRRLLSIRLTIPGSQRHSATKETSFIMKIWYNRRGEKIHRRLLSLVKQVEEKQIADLCIPDPLFYDPDAHVLVYPQVDGKPISASLRRGLSRDWIEKFSRILAHFHTLRLRDLSLRSSRDELICVLDLLKQHMVSSTFRKDIVSVLKVLEKNLPVHSSIGLIHRDFYDQQVLVTLKDQICFIDLDDMAMGDPMLDIGNFIAHMYLMKHWQRRLEKLTRVRQRLLEAYCKRSKLSREITSVLERWYETVALARLAVLQNCQNRTATGDFLIASAKKLIKR